MQSHSDELQAAACATHMPVTQGMLYFKHDALEPRPCMGTQARVGCCAPDAAPLLDVRDAWDALVAHRAGKPWSAALRGLPRAQRDDEPWEAAGVAQTRRRRTEVALSTISERVLGRPMNKAMQCALSLTMLLFHCWTSE